MPMKRFAFILFVFAGLIPGLANAQEEAVLSSTPGPYTAMVGAPLASIVLQRPLPNIFGGADIFGRTVQTGQIDIIYFGMTEDGKAKLRRIDTAINSTASTMSRSPSFTYGQSQGNQNVWGNFSGNQGSVWGSGNYESQTFGMHPAPETTTVLPPRITDFLFEPNRPLSLPSGHQLILLQLDQSQVVFKIERVRRKKNLQ